MAQNDENITDIDSTDAILAVHQGMSGWRKLRSRSVDHNIHVIEV